jgi:hypothetical protein
METVMLPTFDAALFDKVPDSMFGYESDNETLGVRELPLAGFVVPGLGNGLPFYPYEIKHFEPGGSTYDIVKYAQNLGCITVTLVRL